jgi:hypothetical protein
LKSQNEGIKQRREDAEAMAQASLQIEIMNGRMTALDAATEEATAHEKAYQEALEEVNAAIVEANNLPEGEFKKKTLSDRTNDKAHIEATHTIESAQDKQNISSQQVGGAMTKAVNDMVNEWTDASHQIVGLFQNSLNMFNSTLVNVMTSRNRAHQIPREFEAMGHSMFTDATSRSLQAGEGMIGKALGFGGKKPDGSAGNPLHVIMAGGSAIAGAASSAASKAGGFLGSIGKFIQPFFQGAFAEGGNFVANRPMLVGDKGPEILMPGNSGSIIPNHQINGGTTHSISIDARGSTDPAATEAAIHRAMGQYLPAAVGASVGAVKEQGRRVPLSHR